jgi:hypothetical protein
VTEHVAKPDPSTEVERDWRPPTLTVLGDAAALTQIGGTTGFDGETPAS